MWKQYLGSTAGWWLAVFAVGLLAAGPADDAAARPTADQRFLQGLRQRQLFQLAESYCADQLADPRLPLDRRAELVIEYSRTLAEHALASPPGVRDGLWRQATDVARGFIHDYPDSKPRLLVQTQIGLVLAAHGELLAEEAHITGDQRAQLDEARAQLRAAIAHLKRLREQIEQQLFRPDQRTATIGDSWSSDELKALSKNVSFQLARALRNQGEAYPSGSPDRADLLAQSIEFLEPLTRLETTDPLPWQSELERAICFRLLEDPEAARRALDALEESNASAEIKLGIRAQRIRLALAAGQLEAAKRLASEDRRIEQQASPQLDDAILATYLAAWKNADAADDFQGAAAWETRAVDMVRTIERSHGAAWTRRAELLLARNLSSGSMTSSIDGLARAADALYRAGQIDEALSAYDAARKIAENQRQSAAAFDLAYKAAAILHGRSQHREAAHGFRDLALAMSAHSKAGDAHLMAIFNLGKWLEAQDDPTYDEYLQWLTEHLRLWSSGPSADQARWWLGRLLERQRDLAGAVDAYRQVSATHPTFPRAFEALVRCYEKMLADARATAEQKSRQAGEAVEYLERIVSPPPDRYDTAHRIAALAAAKIRLNYLPDRLDQVETLLTDALARSADAPPAWQSAARATLIRALAAQPSRRAAAARMLENMSQSDPTDLLNLAEQLESLAAATTDSKRVELADLQLRACDLLSARRNRLEPGDRRRLDRARAAALAAIGRNDEAHLAYEFLAEQYVRDGRIQEEYAALLTAAGPTATQAALAQWRMVEKRSRSGSPRWLRAKYQIALLHFREGDRARAAKIIQLTKLLHPELGGPHTAAEFDALLDRCRDD